MGKDKKGKDLGRGIRQRSDGRYEARYVDASGERKSLYADTLEGVRCLLRDTKPKDGPHKMFKMGYTLDEWNEIWFRTYKEGKIRETSAYVYKTTYRLSIGPYIGGMNLLDIKKSNVQEVINRAVSDGYGYSRQDSIKRIMHDMLQRAVEDEIIIRNPAIGCRVYAKKYIDRRVLTREEQEIFLENAVGDWYENLFLVALNTGLRPGELFALVPESLDFQKRIIRVNHTLHYRCREGGTHKEFYLGPPKTRQSERNVPMNRIVFEALDRQIEQKDAVSRKHPRDVPYIFVTSRNSPMNSQMYRQAIAHVVGIANRGLPPEEWMTGVYPHAFRHTFATRCLEAGIAPKVVQAYLGHASLQMTMDLYTHVTDDYGRKEIDLLCEI